MCTYFIRDTSEIESLNASLKKFWEIEKVSVLHEINHQYRGVDGTEYCSAIHNIWTADVPWKCNEPVLPNNYKVALQRLENAEKRPKRSPDITTGYSQCIEMSIEKGHVTKNPENEQLDSKWYLPHFPVLRPDKDTTKTRIVFDAALNDKIHQGPKLQRVLFDVLLRFRRLSVAVVCDIEEMYLLIGIAQADKKYHRFLWRGIDQNRQPDVNELDRVVFGVNSSPFQTQFLFAATCEEI